MPASVSRKKINLPIADLAADQNVGRRPKRGIDIVFRWIVDFIHLVQAAAANDANCRDLVCHVPADLMKESLAEKSINLFEGNL